MDSLSRPETWKPIPGYEGIYEASDLGRIRTSKGKKTSNARYPVRIWEQRVLKPKIQTRKNGRKDQRVNLWKDGEESTQLVARLVAMAFLPMPYDKMTVNHINGNPMDNRIENLEWCTLGDNIRHGFNTGLYNKSQKAVILTDQHGEELKFKSMSEASKFLGKSHGYVSEAIARCHYCYSANNVRYYATLVGEDDAES